MTPRTKTFIGYRPVPMDQPEDPTIKSAAVTPSEVEERTERAFLVDSDERTLEADTRALRLQTDSPLRETVLTRDMVQELKRKLREAEARESSGLRPVSERSESGPVSLGAPESVPPSVVGAQSTPLPAVLRPDFTTVDPLAGSRVTIQPPPPSAEVAATHESVDSFSEEPVTKPVHEEPVEFGTRDPLAATRSEEAALGADEEAPSEEIHLDFETDEPDTPSAIDELFGSLPEIEVALAPNSESNFYAGFDEGHPDGIFVATYEPYAIGAPVYAKVLLPADYSFRTAAIVDWVRSPETAEPGFPPGVGLKLCGLDPSMRRLIRTFVRHRKPIFYVG